MKNFKFGTALIDIFWSSGILGGLVLASVWSALVTYNFIRAGTNDNWVAFGFMLAIQYGQNLALYMRKKATTDAMEYLCWAAFAITALLDAGTNVSDWNANNQDVLSMIAGQGWFSTPGILAITWYGINICVVFVEEVVGVALGTMLEKWSALSPFIKEFTERRRRPTADDSGGDAPIQVRPRSVPVRTSSKNLGMPWAAESDSDE